MIGITIPPENETTHNRSSSKPPVAIAYPVMQVVQQVFDEDLRHRPAPIRPNQEIFADRMCRFFIVAVICFSSIGAIMYLFLKPYF